MSTGRGFTADEWNTRVRQALAGAHQTSRIPGIPQALRRLINAYAVICDNAEAASPGSLMSLAGHKTNAEPPIPGNPQRWWENQKQAATKRITNLAIDLEKWANPDLDIPRDHRKCAHCGVGQRAQAKWCDQCGQPLRHEQAG